MFGANAVVPDDDDSFVEQAVTSWRAMSAEAETPSAAAEAAPPAAPVAEGQPAAAPQLQPAATGTGGGGLIDRSKLSAAIAREDGMRASGGTSGAALGNLANRMRKLEG